MGWVKLDDNFPDHEKAAAVGPLAAWLYVCGLCWCSRHLSDGKLPAPDVLNKLAVVPDVDAETERLIAVGLWKRTKTGLRVTNYTKHQRSRAEVEGDRIASRERVQKWREKRKSNGVRTALQSRTYGNVTASEHITSEQSSPLSPPVGDRAALAEVKFCDDCGVPTPCHCPSALERELKLVKNRYQDSA